MQISPCFNYTYCSSSLGQIKNYLHEKAEVISQAVFEIFGTIQRVGKDFDFDIFAWPRLLFTPAVSFPKGFLEELEKNNRGKPVDAPLALILFSQPKVNDEAFYSSSTLHVFLQIAKTHRVVLKMIDMGWLFGRRIKQTALEQGRQIDLLFVSAHGTPTSLNFGQFGCWNRYPIFRLSDLKSSDFSPLSEKATIVLASCYTAEILAPIMTAIAKRTVLASKEQINLVESVFCDRHLLVYKKEQPLMYEFSPNMSPRVLGEGKRSLYKELFQEKHNYITKAANTGDPHGQQELGEIFALGDLVEPSYEHAAHWFSLAAQQGLSHSQYWMGKFCESGLGGIPQSDEEALRWYSLAATQGHAIALRKKGEFHMKGRGGVSPSAEEASACFSSAANQGEPGAQFMLGKFYFEGLGGLEKSTKEAFRWFRYAADLEFPDAEFVVGLFYESGERGVVEKSPQEAFRWFKRAADHGHKQAQNELSSGQPKLNN
ncbi:MAG: tetratricopeptide repeat protein [Chlamydiales bacterium]|nr:tetratricopeptide repeat protein [Chlamydiales bacterium]